MNLIDLYRYKGIPAENIIVGMKLMVLDRVGKGPRIPYGSIGIVEEVKRCTTARCTPYAKELCKGRLITVDVGPGMHAHSCYFRFCTPEGIPIIFKEE